MSTIRVYAYSVNIEFLIPQNLITGAFLDAENVLLQDKKCAKFFGARVLKTSDGGQNWNSFKLALSDWGWPAYVRLGNSSNRLWFAGGVDSSRGLWGTLTREEKAKWVQHRLEGVDITDVAFTDDDHILASGSMLQPDVKEDLREGVVLNSRDGGYTWDIVYRSQAARKINSLAVLHPASAIGVGDNGLIISLTRSVKGSADQDVVARTH